MLYSCYPVAHINARKDVERFLVNTQDGIARRRITGVHTCFFFFSSRRRHTRSLCDWSSDVCSSDLGAAVEHVLAARRGEAAGGVERVEDGHQRSGAVDHGGIDHLPLARALRLQQAAGEAERKIKRAAAEIANEVQGRRRRLPGAADRVQHACQRDVVEVMPGGLGKRAFLAPTGHPAIDQLRVARETRLGPEAEPFHHTGTEALDEGIRGGDEAQHQRHALRVLEVDGDGMAAAVHDAEARVAGQAEAARLLSVDPQHGGAEIGLRAGRGGGRVVVNDPGAGGDGEGNPASGPAQEVVDEIRAAGGTAVANADSVADPAGAERIIRTALEAFGRIDSVVNNAGILRDRIFHRMSHVDWEMVIKVHLIGTFYMSRAAASHFREQESGSYIHFTSTSGLIGNFGQANYAAAKMGIVGLSKSIALDMARYHVRSNCISPFAWSRLIGTIPTDTPEQQARVAKVKTMTSEKIAPLAVFLASDLAKEVSGQIFAVRKNEVFLMSQPRPIRSVHRSEGWSAQTLAEQMLPDVRNSTYSLDSSGDVFSWDPI